MSHWRLSTALLLTSAFTMTQAQAEKLGSRDLALVGSLEFPEKK